MSDETRTRFLAAIAKQLPAERVIEVHLFPAIRQGGTESGVAVLALERAVAPRAADLEEGLPEEVVPLDAFPSLADTSVEIPTDAEVRREFPSLADTRVDLPVELRPEADLPLGMSEMVRASSLPPSRYTVFSARYRYTLKGPDRGKWEVSVTEEADAPLMTIDAVVRGVQQRSGDADETIRLSGEEFRASIPAMPDNQDAIRKT